MGCSYAACTGQYMGVYSVQPGDNLYGIAQSCNLTLTSLLAQNQQFAADPSKVLPGARVCLPTNCSLAQISSAPAPSEIRLPFQQIVSTA